MKPTTFSPWRLLAILLIAGLTIGLVSWDQQQSPGRHKQTFNDTVPKTKSDRDKKIRDLDDVIDELNAVDIKEAMEKAKIEIEKAMKEIDGDKLKLEIEKAMKEVDMEKIMREVKESMAKIDFDNIRKEISEAMKEVDMTKLQAEINESMSKIDMDKLKVELEKVKNIDLSKMEKEINESMKNLKDINMKEMEEGMMKLKEEMKELGPRMEEEMKKVREELKDLGPRIEKEIGDAKVEIEKAKADLQEYKTFVDGLDKDGLISKKENYSLKHEDGELFINGKKASEQVYNKYRAFLEKHKKFKIKKDDDDFDIDMD